MENTIRVLTLRVALYGRVSTLDKGQDVNLQLNELREYSQHRGWAIAGEYVDNGVSGAKESRPELNRLMSDAKKRKFDAIGVWKLDRFGRSLKHLVMTLADLESLGIAFVSLRDGFDLSTPSQDLPNHLRASPMTEEHGDPGTTYTPPDLDRNTPGNAWLNLLTREVVPELHTKTRC